MKAGLFLCLLLAPALLAGQDAEAGRETVLDGIVHLEDSLYTAVPALPRLCDETRSEKRQVDIGDCSLFVEIEGEGVPLVLINGGPGGTHHYFHPWFSRISASHKIIYYDQRGTGLSDFQPGSGYTFRQAADDLEKLRIQLGIGKWFVCGFSYGGGVAQLYAAAYPESVLGLVLISSVPLFESDRFADAQETYLSAAEKARKNEVIREYLAGAFGMDAFLFNLALNGDWKRQNFYRPSREEMIRSALYEWVNDADFNSVVSSDLARYRFRGLFDRCPLPTLIFEGANDLTWGAEKAFAFKENHPSAQFIRFERAAHGVYNDVPDAFYPALEAFTRSAPTVSAGSVREWKQLIEGKISPAGDE